MPNQTIDFGYYWTKQGDNANYSVHWDEATKKLYAVRERFADAPDNRVRITLGTVPDKATAYEAMQDWWMLIHKPNSIDLLQEKVRKFLEGE